MPLPTVILPGYLAAAHEYRAMEQGLKDLGGAVVTVPLQRRDWFVTLGGRPVTPILNHLDRTLQKLLDQTQAPQVNLIGHSAGGWISRIYLGETPYCGQVWHKAPLVKTLITLGTPHLSHEAWTQRNLNFVNQNYPGAFHEDVTYVCVAGKAIYGKPSWRWGEWFTYSSYRMTCGQGQCWGDGVTPVNAAHLNGAVNLVLDGVMHSPGQTKASQPRPDWNWYGSADSIEAWSSYLA